MDLMKSCLLLITFVALLVPQSTLSASIVRHGEVINNKDVSTMVQEVLADLRGLNEKRHISNPFLQLTRLRRNTAQWYVGSHHFNDYNHDRSSSRRWTHRRQNTHHQNTHHHGGGQIADA